MDTKWKRPKIKMTPALVEKLLDYVKLSSTTAEDVANVNSRVLWFSKHGCDTLTTEEFNHLIEKSA